MEELLATRVCCRNVTETRQRVDIGMIEEKHPRFAVLPRAIDDRIPDLARLNRADDLFGARIEQIEIRVVLYSRHEIVRDAD